MPWLSEESRSEGYFLNGKQVNAEQHMHISTFKALTEKLAFVYEELDDLGALPTEDETTEILSMLFMDMLPSSPDPMRDES